MSEIKNALRKLIDYTSHEIVRVVVDEDSSNTTKNYCTVFSKERNSNINNVLFFNKVPKVGSYVIIGFFEDGKAFILANLTNNDFLQISNIAEDTNVTASLKDTVTYSSIKKDVDKIIDDIQNKYLKFDNNKNSYYYNFDEDFKTYYNPDKKLTSIYNYSDDVIINQTEDYILDSLITILNSKQIAINTEELKIISKNKTTINSNSVDLNKDILNIIVDSLDKLKSIAQSLDTKVAALTFAPDPANIQALTQLSNDIPIIEENIQKFFNK